MHSSSTWHFYLPEEEGILVPFGHHRQRKRHRYKSKRLAMTANMTPNSPFLFPIPGVRSGGIRYSAISEVGKGLPQKERGGYFKLAKGWIAVRSSFKLGRVFYYNVETHRSSWIRPVQPDFIEDEDVQLTSTDNRQLVKWQTKLDEDAIYVPNTSSIRQIRTRSEDHANKATDFQEALLAVGPALLLAKIMLVSTEFYFERWICYTKYEVNRKNTLKLWIACKLQAFYRGWKLRKRLEAIRIAKIKAIKCKDFYDIKEELERMYDHFSESEAEWFSYLKRSLPFEGMKGQKDPEAVLEKKENWLQKSRRAKPKKRYG